MRLLVAQLQQQNPLDPQKGAEFVSQLAQLAALEQGAETNQRLGGIEAGQAGASRAAFAGLVGKTVSARADDVTLRPGARAPELYVHLDDPASKVEVVVRDASGKAVRTIALDGQAAGDAAIPFDGTDDQGTPLEGTFHLEVHVTTRDGKAVDGVPRLRGTVDSITFEGGMTRFQVGSASIAAADILAVESGRAAPPPGASRPSDWLPAVPVLMRIP
jgi:flagellar basal-body rod modification protein FlgD